MIDADEVAAAMKHAPSGRAPGLDGLPLELYRRFPDLLTALSCVFSAMGRTGRTPPGFLEGVIRPIHKKGDVTCVGNHRPITLLNTDYRILAVGAPLHALCTFPSPLL